MFSRHYFVLRYSLCFHVANFTYVRPSTQHCVSGNLQLIFRDYINITVSNTQMASAWYIWMWWSWCIAHYRCDSIAAYRVVCALLAVRLIDPDGFCWPFLHSIHCLISRIPLSIMSFIMLPPVGKAQPTICQFVISMYYLWLCVYYHWSSRISILPTTCCDSNFVTIFV